MQKVEGSSPFIRECGREVDEFTAIAEKWGYRSDGTGELLPFCLECARREFAPLSRASDGLEHARQRGITSSRP